jgi:hypothetical protein
VTNFDVSKSDEFEHEVKNQVHWNNSEVKYIPDKQIYLDGIEELIKIIKSGKKYVFRFIKTEWNQWVGDCPDMIC